MTVKSGKTSLAAKPARSTGKSDPLAGLLIRRASVHGGYGWTRDTPDARDVLYCAALLAMPKGMPNSVDLRSKCPPVYDQGQLGSCTANGIGAAIEFDQMAGPPICGVVLPNAGPNGEPLACAWPADHLAEHSWASLPTQAQP